MRLYARKPYDRLFRWHPWFAWHPVWACDGDIERLVWLETVQRSYQRVPPSLVGLVGPSFVYRVIFK